MVMFIFFHRIHIFGKMENEHKILRALYDQNEWWSTSKVPDALLKTFRRRDFYVLKDALLEKKITAIVGPRQVGKTSTMYQLIDDLITQKVNPNRILYISFDYPYLTTITETPLNDVMEAYSSQILREPVQKLKGAIYVFLDEVCKLKDWSRILKGWHDLKYPIKFIVSDSSSADILKGSSESLVGRIDTHIMLSMKFVDLINYKEGGDAINHISIDLRNMIGMSIKESNPEKFYAALKESYANLIPHEDSIKIYLQDYLLKDGYPELLDEDSTEICSKRLREYINLTLYKDIMRVFDIHDPKALENLVTRIADETAQRMEYANLSSELSIKEDTLKKYLNCLESAFMVSRSEFYSRNRASRIRKARKIYLSNVGLRNALVGQLNRDLLNDSAELGRIAETLVYEHCKRLKYCLEPGSNAEIFYWKNKKGEEVDIVMEIARRPIPIEVKYRKKIDNEDLKGINEFLEKYQKTCLFGIVITKDLLEMRGKLIFVPLWLFLMAC
ncbi:MAG: hypothetical protein CVT47_00680 [Thermoplasmata archaeon HGW-Thermoplasmata-2]|nr:MAG: hypothetical protein CVT47_00680 [Thermoplasmata archaeon HGW-Thermoplasmata-2]